MILLRSSFMAAVAIPAILHLLFLDLVVGYHTSPCDSNGVSCQDSRSLGFCDYDNVTIGKCAGCPWYDSCSEDFSPPLLAGGLMKCENTCPPNVCSGDSMCVGIRYSDLGFCNYDNVTTGVCKKCPDLTSDSCSSIEGILSGGLMKCENICPVISDGEICTRCESSFANGTGVTAECFEAIATLGRDVLVSFPKCASGIAGTRTDVTDPCKISLDIHLGCSGITSKTIVDIIRETPNLSTLFTATSYTDVGVILSGDGPFTVLAPTDDAFNALGMSEAEFLALIGDGTASTILKGHAASGTVLSTDLFEGQVITTVSGLNLTVSLADGVTFTGPSNTVKVTTADIEASNGVVHVIDAVIMLPAPVSESPASVSDSVASEETVASEESDVSEETVASEEASSAFGLMAGSALASAVVGFVLL